MNDGCFLGAGVILTYTGKAFNVASPRLEDIYIEDIAHALSLICRFNGCCKDYYSVAQHSVMVAQLCPSELALAGLLHDAHEAYVSDLTSPIKRVMPVETAVWWAQMVWRLDVAIGRRFGLEHGWENSKGVQHADLLALAAEGRDLMNGWDNEKFPDPKDIPVIQPWIPKQAENYFLDWLKEYSK